MEQVQARGLVNIYQVKDEHGDEYPFSAIADEDGDIIITLTESPVNFESVKVFAVNNMDELINDSCDDGLANCIHAILKHRPELFKQVVKCYEQ